MKAKCPYCKADINMESLYNSIRKLGGVACFDAESTGYQKCTRCSRVFKFICNMVKGWQRVTATVALPNNERPWGVYDEVIKK